MAGFISTLASTKMPTITKFDRTASAAADSYHRMSRVGVIKRGPSDSRTISVCASTNEVDRGGDIVEQSGIDYRSWLMLGGTILWQHDPAQPIALCTDIGVRNNELHCQIQFPPKGVSATADEVYGLVKAGVVNATSIGFKPLEMEPLGTGGWHFKKIELMEISIVSVPANQGARIVQRSMAASPDPNMAAWCQAKARELADQAVRRGYDNKHVAPVGTLRPAPTQDREIERMRRVAKAIKVSARDSLPGPSVKLSPAMDRLRELMRAKARALSARAK